MINVIKKILKYPRVTLKYPRKPMDLGLFIGKPIIDPLKCTNCNACIAHCPSGAIVENPKTQELGINYDTCIFCALCEELCPSMAVTMSSEFELAERNRNDLRVAPIQLQEDDMQNQSYEELGIRLDQAIIKRFGRSLNIREVDAGSCNACDNEINTTNNPFNDIERFGIHFVASPRHADMLLITGTASRNMETALLKTYEATPDPKLVVAVGTCACSGGIFRDSYATRNGIDCLVPVDVYIPGCPPRPQAILYGILKALDKI